MMNVLMVVLVTCISVLPTFIGSISETTTDRFLEDDSVIILTEENFNAALVQFSKILINFYAPWCGHCKALNPEFSKAAATLKAQNSPVLFAKIDSNEATDLMEKYGIAGLPTIILFMDGRPTIYDDGRTTLQILDWLRRKIGPRVTNVDDVFSTEAIIASSQFLVMGFFKGDSLDKVATFVEVADKLEDILFLVTDQEAVFKYFNVTQNAQVSIFKQFDGGRLDQNESMTARGIENFIERHRLPNVIPYNKAFSKIIVQSRIKNHVLLFTNSSADNFNQVYQAFEKTSVLFKGKALFIMLNVSEPESHQIMASFGLVVEDSPSIMFVKAKETSILKYHLEHGDLATTATIESFVRQHLEEHVLSEESSVTRPGGYSDVSLKHLTMRNFSTVVTHLRGHVVVQFFSPSCIHCQRLAAAWKQLEELFQQRHDVIISKMDATQNDVAVIGVDRLPTIRHYHRSADEFRDFIGDRTFENLVAFVNECIMEEGMKLDKKPADIELSNTNLKNIEL